jgi:hypothetical protein
MFFVSPRLAALSGWNDGENHQPNVTKSLRMSLTGKSNLEKSDTTAWRSFRTCNAGCEGWFVRLELVLDSMARQLLRLGVREDLVREFREWLNKELLLRFGSGL